jgi:hypothetical protein
MSISTYSSSSGVSGEAASYGGFVDALGGIATIVLAIITLSGAMPEALLTIVFAAALLIQGGAMLGEFAQIEATPDASVAIGRLMPPLRNLFASTPAETGPDRRHVDRRAASFGNRCARASLALLPIGTAKQRGSVAQVPLARLRSRACPGRSGHTQPILL